MLLGIHAPTTMGSLAAWSALPMVTARSTETMTTMDACVGHQLSLHFFLNMMCDALAYPSEHSLQAFRVETISRRLGPGLGGTP